MKMTPIVRYKNINLENFKKFLKMYPYLVDNKTWEESFKYFNFENINTDYDGYKKTAYQFACQVGIENRGNNFFEVNDYLFYLNDEQLQEYLKFWILTYYAPNPYVASDDSPKIIWSDIARNILSSKTLEIDYYKYFYENINDKINVSSPTNIGNPDTLLNVIIDYGIIIKLKDKRFLYIDESEKDNLLKLINYIESEFPIPKDYKNKTEFFTRYSFQNFIKFFPKKREKNIKNLDVNFQNEFKVHDLYFENKETIEKQITKALKSGKHIILTGPPGTGKSKLAKQICDKYNVKYNMTTAISDWSTYETVGGYKLNKDGNLYFDPGIFLTCFKDEYSEVKNEWLIIDEINRADIDKSFGSFFSSLAGDSVTLSFKDENNNNIHIINENDIDIKKVKNNEYVIPNNWRLIGTINTFDKTSLFEMSYAFMRRFAFVPISVPKNIDVEMIKEYLELWSIPNKSIGSITLAYGLTEIWKIINSYREIGPAIIKDIGSYVEEEEDWVSAIILYVLPQFDGMDEQDIKSFINGLISSNIDGIKKEKNILNDFVKDFFGLFLYD